jgi:hypothetical protein
MSKNKIWRKKKRESAYIPRLLLLHIESSRQKGRVGLCLELGAARRKDNKN